MRKGKTAVVSAAVRQEIYDRLIIEGLLRDRAVSGEAAARLSSSLSGGSRRCSLPPEIAEALGGCWSVFFLDAPGGLKISLTCWIAPEIKKKLERDRLRRGENLTTAAGRIVMETMEPYMPGEVAEIVGELKKFLPRYKPIGTPLPHEAGDLIVRLKAAIAIHEQLEIESEGGKSGGKGQWAVC